MPSQETRSARLDYRWVILIVATMAQATASFPTQGLGILAGFLQQDLALTNADVGLLIAAAHIAPIVMLPIVGDLLDRRSERVIIATGATVLAAGLVLTALGPSFGWLLVTLFVAGCGYSTTQPGGSKSVTVWFRGRQLGFAMGIRQAGLPLGAAAAAAALPLIASVWGWRVAFVVGAAVALAGALTFSAVYRSPPAATADTRPHSRASLSIAVIVATLRHPWMRGAILAGTALVSAQYAILTYFMLYLRDDHAIALVDGAWLMFVTQLCGVAGRVVLGSFSDRPGRSRFRLVIASMVAIGAGMLLLALLPPQMPWWLWLPVAAWLGFFGLGWYGPWIAFLADVAPPERLGFAIGTALAFNQAAAVVGPPILGLLHDLTGGYAVAWSCVVALLAAAMWATHRVR